MSAASGVAGGDAIGEDTRATVASCLVAQTISHRAGWDADAESVYRVLVDGDYLQARLAELGGKDPALVERSVDDSGARLKLRHSVDVEFLPGVIKRFTGGDLVLDRVETWTPEAGGGYRGTFEVTVRGLPGKLTGKQSLHDVEGGSQSTVDGSAEVPVPFVAGKIESVVNEQVGGLLDAEDEFTRRWLAEH
ncbi:MAG: hypothetical protein QOE59_4160 [Actinomycetota bacterium]|nr:hypothetical protein [Actinomycetota bacterium]